MELNQTNRKKPKYHIPLRQLGIEDSYACSNPNRLLDRLRELNGLHSDAQLCRLLRVSPPLISKLRSGRMNVSAALLIRIHDVFGIAIADLRAMLAQA